MVKSEPTSPAMSSEPPPSSSTNKTTMKKKYKGVRMRSWGSWVSEIRAPNQKARIWLGSYSTPEAAARAYDAALLCIKGTSAASNFNFPDNISRYTAVPLDGNPLMSPKSIQKAAAAAATSSSFPPHSMSPPTDGSYPSPSDHRDDVVLPPEQYNIHQFNYETQLINESMASLDWWCNFESPKYVDLSVNGAAFDSAGISNASYLDDFFDEEGDIRLWSFC